MTALALAIVAVSGGLLLVLIPLALHRLLLLWRSRREGPREALVWQGPWPRITVQLPVYNEAEVVERLIRAAVALDYPPAQLEIQVLDDSNDETTARIAELLGTLPAEGPRVTHLRRPTRAGFKAGALAHGLAHASGDFVLILDADFVPEPALLHQLLPPFSDPAVGMVQARWDHLNEDRRLLTRGQALLLDGHFFFEQGGRYRSGRFMNFNGTAGLWRRAALESSGGWASDTLTEDLDLSYRAQMAGWRFVFLGEVGVPAELPEGVRALEVQQKRWAQGGVQTGRKLLPRIWRGPLPLRVKLEATVHLFGHVAHPMTVVLGVLLLPSAVARVFLGLGGWLALDFLLFLAATGSFFLFYLSAARMRGRPWVPSLGRALATMALGIGLTAPVSRAVLAGLSGLGARTPFHRTPKGGALGLARYGSPAAPADTVLKLGLALWMLGSTGVALALGYFATVPFLVLFGVGWGWLGVGELRDRRRGRAGAFAPLR
jgi:cellulose synthase/poly-beta-1,6-N-acetylglucosamine synthase-like glycosyltransferase